MAVTRLKKTTVTVTTEDGRRDVEGWIHPPYSAPRFAVTPVVLSYGTSPYYSITHVPTGMMLGWSYDKRMAFRAVRALAELLDDPMWDNPSLTDDEIAQWGDEFPAKYRAARQALGLGAANERDGHSRRPRKPRQNELERDT